MAHLLELRSPFLDWEVLELGVSLPRELKVKAGAARRRCGARSQTTDEITERGKSGFGVPLADWFRNGLRDLAVDVLLDSRAGAAAATRRRAPAP